MALQGASPQVVVIPLSRPQIRHDKLSMIHFIIQEEGRRPDSSYYHVGDGYYYNYHSDNDTTVYFRCNRSVCGGRAHLHVHNGFTESSRHNHAPDLLYSEVQNAAHRIVQQARSLVYRSISDIIVSERARIQNRAVRSRLTLRRLRPAMLRARAEIFPNIPSSLAELTTLLQDPAWACLTRTNDLEDSIYLGSAWGHDGSHSVVFISRRCLEIMRVVPILFADGTFYITPSIHNCYQVFTLVAVYGHTAIPLCWCIMERKTQDAYIAVLTLVRNHLVQWAFIRIVCDFEDAIINAFTIVFAVEVQGCLFHSANAMAQHARLTIGTVILQQFPAIKNIVRLCCALPLLPLHLVQAGLNAIGTLAMDLGDIIYIIILRPYLQYVQFEWVYHANRGRTLSVCGSEHRTNNVSESNNKRMRVRFGAPHPNIFRFIRGLTDIEDMVLDDLQSLFQGIIPTRHRAVSAISNDERIQRLTAELLQTPVPSEEQILTFLSSAAQCLDGVVNDAMVIPRQ